MESGGDLHDVVALLEELPAAHFATGQPLVLRRGQVGTVVRCYGGAMLEVEFAGPDGRAYAILPIESSKVIVLRDAHDYAAA